MSAVAKLNRAKNNHLKELEESIAQFNKLNPFSCVSVEDKESGDLVFRARILKPIPSEEWGIIVGDLIHNLRSALDLRISELVTSNGNIVKKNNAFPFAKDIIEFEKVCGSRLVGLAENQVQIVKDLKPYGGGNEILWELHQLDIMDKHKKLLIAGSAQQSVVVDFAADLQRMNPDWNIPSMPLALRPAERDFPIIDGAVLYRIKKQARQAAINEKATFLFEVAYSDGSDAFGEPLLPKMNKFIREVESILTLLR